MLDFLLGLWFACMSGFMSLVEYAQEAFGTLVVFVKAPKSFVSQLRSDSAGERKVKLQHLAFFTSPVFLAVLLRKMSSESSHSEHSSGSGVKGKLMWAAVAVVAGFAAYKYGFEAYRKRREGKGGDAKAEETPKHAETANKTHHRRRSSMRNKGGNGTSDTVSPTHTSTPPMAAVTEETTANAVESGSAVPSVITDNAPKKAKVIETTKEAVSEATTSPPIASSPVTAPVESSDAAIPAISPAMSPVESPRTPVEPASPPVRRNSTNAEKAAAAQKRALAIHEIFTTEETYVNSLHVIVDKFMKPLQEQIAKSKIKVAENDVTAMFGNIQSILDLHETLNKDLQATGETGDVGAVFVKFAAFLRMYTQYLSRYDAAMEAMNKYRDNRKFQQFLTDVRGSLQSRMDIMSYLIMPVQRIPRYELLLKEVVKRTPEDHPHYGSLKTALSKIVEVAIQLNERKRFVENMSEMLGLQNRISGLDYAQLKSDTLVIPTRKLVHKGFCKMAEKPGKAGAIEPPSPNHQRRTTGSSAADPVALDNAGRDRSLSTLATSAVGTGNAWGSWTGSDKLEWKERELVLFNDCLMWLSQQDKFKGLIAISANTRVTPLPPAGDMEHIVEVVGHTFLDPELVVIAVSFASQHEQEHWLAALENVVKDVSDHLLQQRAQGLERKQRLHASRNKMHSNIAESLMALQAKKGNSRTNSMDKSPRSSPVNYLDPYAPAPSVSSRSASNSVSSSLSMHNSTNEAVMEGPALDEEDSGAESKK